MNSIVWGGVVPVLLGIANFIALAMFKQRRQPSRRQALIHCALGSYLVCAGASRLAQPNAAVSAFFGWLSVVAVAAFVVVVVRRAPDREQPANGTAV